MADEPMGEPEDDEEEGLMDKIRKKEVHDGKEYKQLTYKEFKHVVFGYFAEGFLNRPRYVWKKVKREYKVDGKKVVLGDIFALKHKYVAEYGESDEGAPRRRENSTTAFAATPEERNDLMKLYNDAKHDNNKDLQKRIENKLLGEPSQQKSVEDRLKEASLRRIEGGGTDGVEVNTFQKQMQEQMLSQMKFQTEVMALQQQRMEIAMKSSGGGALSMDPTVALAQVITPAVKDGFSETNETLREIGGLDPKEKKLKPGEEKKVEDAKKVIQKFQQINSLFCECSNCSAIIPKVASMCPRCGIIFEPSEEEIKLAAEKQAAKGREPVTPLTPEELAAKAEEAKKGVKAPVKGQQKAHKLPIEGDEVSKFPKELLWLEEYFKPDGYLTRLRNKIKNGHDAKKTMRGAWNLTETVEDQKKLLYVATKGFTYILDMAKPYVGGFGQEELYKFFDTDDAKIWLNIGLGEIKNVAKEDKVVLTSEDIKKFEAGVEKYVKEVETPAVTPPKPKMTTCALCGEEFPVDKVDAHMETCQQEQLKKLEAEERAKFEKEKAEKEKKGE